MSVSVRIEHEAGGTTTLTHLSSERRQSLNQIDVMQVRVPRAEATAANLVTDADEVYLVDNGTDVFGGLLGDLDRTGTATTTLIVDSFERQAREAEPSGADVEFTGVDDVTVVNEAITSAGLTAGTVENVKSNLTFEFNHTSPARRLRRVREASGGELRYNPDKTVDYVGSLGSVRTMTLSPDAGNVAGFRVERDSGQKRANKLRLLGSGEGDAQVVVNVTAPTFQGGDREVWDTLSFKDVSAASTLTEIGTELVKEMGEEAIEVNATVKGVTVSLGDTFRVLYPEEDVDHELRVVGVTSVISNEGRFYEATLSNRQLSRRNIQERVVTDVERLNRGSSGANIGVYDNPNNAPQDEGKIIYVTGNNADYAEGIWRNDGAAYTDTMHGDVINERVHTSKSFVVPVGTDKYDLMVLPTGTDKYST